MSKSTKATKVPAKELSEGFTIKLPDKLRADEVTIVSIEDGCKTMNVQPCTVHVAKVIGAFGPFKKIEATILLDSNGDVIVTDEPKKKGMFSGILPSLCVIAGLVSFLTVMPYV